MKDLNDKIPTIDTFIDDQSLYKELPYGSNGTIADNGCGCISCYNALKYLGYTKSFEEIYHYFNDDKKLLMRGSMGTNPFHILKYLKTINGITIKTHISYIPKKEYDAYIVLNLYKNENRKMQNGHYIFGYFKDGNFFTYNLNNIYIDLKDYFKKTKTFFYIIYGIKQHSWMI